MTMSSVYVYLVTFFVVGGVCSHQQVSEGQCAMYGICGVSPITQKPVPCVYSGPAKPLTDPGDRRLLNDLCPDLAQEKSTCCDSSQLKQLQSWMDVPRQVLGKCPACLHNFMNIFCYMYCNPYQSKYLAVVNSFKSKSVKSIHYDITTTFADGMFNSCKDVKMPSSDERAIGVFCGHPTAMCTPQNWLDYMGNIRNGQTPFDVIFNITDYPETLPSWITLNPMNATAVPCSSPIGNYSACLCQDCDTNPCPTTPTPIIPVYPCASQNQRIPTDLRRDTPSAYQPVSLVIQRTGRHPPVTHHLPPPSSDVVMFNAIFNKTFLHEILDLLTTIQTMEFPFNTRKVSLTNVCLQNVESKRCVVPSPLQYFQNSLKNIDKEVLDPSGYFMIADDLDHLLACFREPWIKRDYPLNTSCISDYGDVVRPHFVFCGYDGNNYQNATALVATFFIKDTRVSAASAAWRTGLLDFVDNWQMKHKDVHITTYQPTPQDPDVMG